VVDRFVIHSDRTVISLDRTGQAVVAAKRRNLHYPKQVQDDKDDGNHDQDVNPITGPWKARTYVPAEKAEQPQDE
jgi:hypothetical protein